MTGSPTLQREERTVLIDGVLEEHAKKAFGWLRQRAEVYVQREAVRSIHRNPCACGCQEPATFDGILHSIECHV